MANNSGVLQRASTTVALCFTAGTHANSTFAVSVILLVAFPCFAQDQPRPLLLAGANSGAQVSGQTATVTIPAGTRLALVLTSRLSSKTVHRGDTIYAQMTAPVAVGNSVAIPAGTFVQGQVNELTRHDSRAEIQLEAVSLLFSGGYVANVAGPMTIETDEGTAWRVATRGGIAAAVAAPAIGAAGGALVGHAANSSSGSTVNGLTINPDRMQSTAIGAMAGLAAGGVVGLLMFAHSRQFFVDVGSPMELDLPHSVALAQDRVTDAVRQSLSQPTSVTPVANRPPPPTPTPSPTHTCYTPGTPGTPQIVIPGTPPIGGSPGTPDIVIPGTPPIPGTPYPCD